jgi:hypothetical protein
MDTNKSFLYQIVVSCLTATLLTMFSCDKYEDNYDGPNANFHGTLIDVNTNKALPSEQPNGFQIQFRELSWGPDATSQTIEGKPDGTFNYDFLFGYTDKKYDGSPYSVATYEVQPINGAFIMAGQTKDTIEVYPNQKVEVNFQVQPYIELNLISSNLVDTVLTVSYSMSRPIFPTERINQSAVVISSRTKYLSANLNTGGWEDKYTVRKQAPNLITYTDGQVITEMIHLDRGKTYWMRLAAKSTKTSYWNYTETTEFTIP